MMTNIHFFGCSFTAGDELTDDYFFPWKKDCLMHTAQMTGMIVLNIALKVF